jgi:hypothetical protein
LLPVSKSSEVLLLVCCQKLGGLEQVVRQLLLLIMPEVEQ